MGADDQPEGLAHERTHHHDSHHQDSDREEPTRAEQAIENLDEELHGEAPEGDADPGKLGMKADEVRDPVEDQKANMK